jgi:diaminopimelate epimerase
MEIQFYKYQGTGNDFVVVDNRNGEYNYLTQTQIEKICDRKFGIGADGFMMLELQEGYDFRMKYFNADGNEGSMCGNGGRCLVQFAWDMGIQKDRYHFIAVDGPHEAQRSKNKIHLKMIDVTQVSEYEANKTLNTGSPHLIQFVDSLDQFDVYSKGRAIRYSDPFRMDGINVNFVCRTNGGIRVRTYERGVENETLSCGTGVTAAALASSTQNGEQITQIQVEGGVLEVSFNRLNNHRFENIWLIGPAEFVFKGTIHV